MRWGGGLVRAKEGKGKRAHAGRGSGILLFRNLCEIKNGQRSENGSKNNRRQARQLVVHAVLREAVCSLSTLQYSPSKIVNLHETTAPSR